jgi:y4mF family transcriptional regulator
MQSLDEFVKERRKVLGLTQPELAEKAGVGLRFLRELEGGKTTLRLDRVNTVLALFGHELAPVPMDRGFFESKVDTADRRNTRSME